MKPASSRLPLAAASGLTGLLYKGKRQDVVQAAVGVAAAAVMCVLAARDVRKDGQTLLGSKEGNLALLFLVGALGRLLVEVRHEGEGGDSVAPT